MDIIGRNMLMFKNAEAQKNWSHLVEKWAEKNTISKISALFCVEYILIYHCNGGPNELYTATDINKCGDLAGAGNSHLIVTHISVPHCRAQPGMKLVLWTSKQHCYTLIQQFIIQRLNYTTIWDIVIQVKSFKVSHLEYNFFNKIFSRLFLGPDITLYFSDVKHN